MIITQRLHFNHIPNINSMQIIFLTNAFIFLKAVKFTPIGQSIIKKPFKNFRIFTIHTDTHLFVLLTVTIYH